MGVVCGAVPSEQILILQWLINIVDSDVIQICYREKDDSHFCNVLNLPNWAFSYALASFLLLRTVGTNDDETDAELLKDKAGMSLQDALGRFPSFVGLLLRSLNINTTGRSLRRDWVSLLDAVSIRSNQLLRTWRETSQDSFVLASTLQTCDQIIKIYVKQIAKFWADDDILQWLFDNLSVVAMRTETDATPWPPPPSAAILRYANVNPLDYDDKIQTMPPDANIMNPGLLEHALNVQTNRPRFLRRQMRDEGRNFDMHGNIAGAHGNALNQRAFLGPPTHNVDPDWPMLEVFWRSFLPWNHVDGIPPPRR